MLVRVTFHSIINSEMFRKLLWFFVNFSFRTRTCSFVSLLNIILQKFFIVLSWNFVRICTFIREKRRMFFDEGIFSTSFWSLLKNSFLTVLSSIDCIMSYNASSKEFKCSFWGGVAGDLKLKRFCGFFSGFSFSLQTFWTSNSTY